MIVSSIAGRAVAVWISLAIGLGPTEPGPEEPEAVEEVEDVGEQPSAAELFQDRRYREAAEAFAREYARDPKPALLFGRGQALLRSGDCFGAIESFEEFLATEPPDADANAARDQVTYCRGIIEANSKRDEEEATEEAEPPPPIVEGPVQRAEPWHRDRMGSIFVGIGSPVLITGAILYGGSFGIANGDAPQLHTEHDQREGRVRGMAATGLALLGVGAALVVAGAVRWGVLARRRAPRRASRGMRGLVWRHVTGS